MSGDSPVFHPGHQRGTQASPAAPRQTPMSEQEAVEFLTPQGERMNPPEHWAGHIETEGAMSPKLADMYRRFKLDADRITTSLLGSGEIRVTAPVTIDGETIGSFDKVYPTDHRLADGTAAFTIVEDD